MDSMQASLEAESRAKAEALRIKKKLESDINELEIALDHANKANAEALKSIKRYQNQQREVEGALEEEHRLQRPRSFARCAPRRMSPRPPSAACPSSPASSSWSLGSPLSVCTWSSQERHIC